MKAKKNVNGGTEDRTHDPSDTKPACCHGSIRITLKIRWKTKPIFSANNKDSIIIRPMELAPLHVLGWVRVGYVKKFLYFITGSFDRPLYIQQD